MGYKDTTAYKIAKAMYDNIIHLAPSDFLKNIKYREVGIVPSLEEQNFPALLVAAEVSAILTRGIRANHVYVYDVVITYITKSKVNDINSIYEELETVDDIILTGIEAQKSNAYGLSSEFNILFYPTVSISNSFEIRDYPRMNETYIVYRTYTLRCEVMKE